MIHLAHYQLVWPPERAVCSRGNSVLEPYGILRVFTDELKLLLEFVILLVPPYLETIHIQAQQRAE